MNIEELREYCLNKHAATESFPFDETTLVFKVGGKMFALSDLNPPHGVNLKFDPEDAILARDQFQSVSPGYHMSKSHWNTILIEGDVSDMQIKQWIDNSYELVFNKLSKKLQKEILESKL